MVDTWQQLDFRTDPDEAEYRCDPGDLLDVGSFVDDLLRRPEWMADALCREHPELSWFPARGEDVRPAKEICAGCMVRSECAAFAVDAGPLLVGIWAGLSDRGRRQLRRTPPMGESEAA